MHHLTKQRRERTSCSQGPCVKPQGGAPGPGTWEGPHQPRWPHLAGTGRVGERPCGKGADGAGACPPCATHPHWPLGRASGFPPSGPGTYPVLLQQRTGSCSAQWRARPPPTKKKRLKRSGSRSRGHWQRSRCCWRASPAAGVGMWAGVGGRPGSALEVQAPSQSLTLGT